MDQWTLHLCVSREFTFLNSWRFSFLLYDFVYLLTLLMLLIQLSVYRAHFILWDTYQCESRAEEKVHIYIDMYHSCSLSLSFSLLMHCASKFACAPQARRQAMTRRLETMPFTVSNWLTSLERSRKRERNCLLRSLHSLTYTLFTGDDLSSYFLFTVADRVRLQMKMLALFLSLSLCSLSFDN